MKCVKLRFLLVSHQTKSYLVGNQRNAYIVLGITTRYGWIKNKKYLEIIHLSGAN